ncbi:hormone-sensitive lipase isoform X2 [Rhipicephalus sanguineus]|uniref:hormone-sensitive lipase isoform X2 n=1 Tax=Rhipicephalus sanguineus TaxID=34632 RepID=UPI0020C1D883|nr:hormone-sensitive lipase isoform X2 [Rhipicephalus sanguineus]
MLCCGSDSENLEDCRPDSAPASCSLVNMSRIGRPRSGLYEMLTTMVRANIEYFREVETETGSKILAHLNSMEELLHSVEASANRIISDAHLFDFDSETHANGFRSIVSVADRFIPLTTKLCRALQMKRGSPFFRGESFAKELGDHVGILRGLRAGLSILEQMMEHTDKGSLFVNENMKFNDLFKEFDNFDPTSFYGRCMGFYKVNKFISSSLQVCCDVVVPLERLGLPKVEEPSIVVEIPCPSAHGPPAPVRCRLLSSAVRDGMQSLLPSNLVNSSDVLPPSHGLILHFHGGGFIAQSAESHEIYLKDWARLVNVPILSVDYSLSPESPYPRALEEVTFVYGWVLNNCHKLGTHAFHAVNEKKGALKGPVLSFITI